MYGVTVEQVLRGRTRSKGTSSTSTKRIMLSFKSFSRSYVCNNLARPSFTSLTAAASDGLYSSATEEASSRDAYICHFAHSPRRVFQILDTAKPEHFSLSQYSMHRHFVLLKSQPLSWAGIFTSLPWSSLSRQMNQMNL
ncbi:hypothetical protein SLEP1_g36853 [Rubroshorea leprosula]|uniref:Uncharacterized protein n=1 Tax=Rubroshorea leprosula TaxID=152421 RepID=A0AAV5KTA3_9ROSI|nr:hypothetical protein SLEP1_g36853 [Rubroshorea leprosula]